MAKSCKRGWSKFDEDLFKAKAEMTELKIKTACNSKHKKRGV